MTASSHVTIWCDAFVPEHELRTLPGGGRLVIPGGQCLDWIDYGESTAKGTRRRIRQSGWVYRNGKDYCPNHAREVAP